MNAFGTGKAGATMNRRNATTLTEVLVAIFIMGIGLMAILALFPLGAARWRQRLRISGRPRPPPMPRRSRA